MRQKIRVEACQRRSRKYGDSQVLVLPLFMISSPEELATWIPKGVEGLVAHVHALGDFDGRVEEAVVLYPDLEGLPGRLLLIGLGEKEMFSADRSREMGAVAGRYCADHNRVDMLVDGLATGSVTLDSLVQSFIEGFLLAAWEKDMDERSSSDAVNPRIIRVLVGEKLAINDIQETCDRGIVVAEAIQLARDISNAPASDLTPSAFGSLSSRVAESSGIRCAALTQDEMAEARLSGLRAVSQGSAEPPAFIILEYAPKVTLGKPVVLVGKGITFDSGGLNLKPGAKLPRMKHDKSGVGVVLAVMSALAKLEVPLHVVGLLPVAENMPSGTATKPGDVITMASGKTVEIISTDAEGRLILADTLLYARRFSPKCIIDVASLTGATRVALGDEASAIFSNSRQLEEELVQAGHAAGEPVWAFPLKGAYLKDLHTPFADLRNIPLSTERGGGGCIAAAFLSQFVSCSWAHIDTAGTAWDNHSRRYYPQEGASGFAVRLLIEFLGRYKEERDHEIA